MHPTDRLLTPGEVAELFRVGPKTVTRWAAEGKLNSIRTPGRHRRFAESQVRALLEGRVATADVPANVPPAHPMQARQPASAGQPVQADAPGPPGGPVPAATEEMAAVDPAATPSAERDPAG